MTDRELLELAAKAAGMELDYTIRPDKKAFYHSERNALALVDGGWFAPLTDDGDALRLAVKLGLVVDCSRPSAGEPWKQHAIWLDETMSNAELTRRAIVRAAAAIGRQMP